jgi:hypothetical protein
VLFIVYHKGHFKEFVIERALKVHHNITMDNFCELNLTDSLFIHRFRYTDLSIAPLDTTPCHLTTIRDMLTNLTLNFSTQCLYLHGSPSEVDVTIIPAGPIVLKRIASTEVLNVVSSVFGTPPTIHLELTSQWTSYCDPLPLSFTVDSGDIFLRELITQGVCGTTNLAVQYVSTLTHTQAVVSPYNSTHEQWSYTLSGGNLFHGPFKWNVFTVIPLPRELSSQTAIIPATIIAVIIVIVMFLALIVACICFRKRLPQKRDGNIFRVEIQTIRT